jgi:hypothetical protein
VIGLEIARAWLKVVYMATVLMDGKNTLPVGTDQFKSRRPRCYTSTVFIVVSFVLSVRNTVYFVR